MGLVLRLDPPYTFMNTTTISPSLSRVLRAFAWLALLSIPVAMVHPESQASVPEPPRLGRHRAKRPNILILVGDDHAGGLLGIDGDPRRATPRLDAPGRRKESGSTEPIAMLRSARRAGSRSSPVGYLMRWA